MHAFSEKLSITCMLPLGLEAQKEDAGAITNQIIHHGAASEVERHAFRRLIYNSRHGRNLL